MLLSNEFLALASERLGVEKSALTESHLRRATSDLYYAMFHTICEELARDAMAGEPSSAERQAYLNLYRAPDHKTVEQACRSPAISSLPREVQDFARWMVVMKNKREEADYNPLVRFELSDTRKQVEAVQAAIIGFRALDRRWQRAFAAFAGMKMR